jgi:superfamily II DNA or RNA helicase
MFQLEVNNSFCNITGPIDPNTNDLIKRILTYQNDIQGELNNLFGKLKFFNSRGLTEKANQVKFRIKELQKTEWVCWYKNNTFPTGHLNIVKDLLNNLKVDYELIDRRKKTKPNLIMPLRNKLFAPRYYQDDMVKLGLKHGRGVFESAVGTGKTLIMMHLINQIKVTSLIVVPSSGLKHQIYNELVTYFGPKHVEIIDGKKVRASKSLKSLRIVTIQTIAALQKSNDLNHLVHDVDALYIDEIHHAGAKSYTDMLSEIDHIYWRFGFTGTFLRNDSKHLDLWGFLSNKLYSYPAWKAIEDGYLTPIEVITYNLDGKKKMQYQKEYDANYCGSIEINNAILDVIHNAKATDQILILVNKKDKAGKIFHELLNAHGIKNSYISGDDKAKVITQTISDFNDKKVNILIGSSVIGEGIDIRSADHLVLAQGGKSEITIVQAVGRLVRLFEGKERGYLYDFNFSNTKYMKKHLGLRKNILERNFQPIGWSEI